MTKSLLSCDLNCCRITDQMYTNLLKALIAKEGDMDIHLYNYSVQKHTFINSQYGEIIHKSIGSRKRVTLDIEQALDCVKLCCSGKYENAYILSGEYDSLILYQKLTELGCCAIKIDISPNSMTLLPFNNSIQPTTLTAISSASSTTPKTAHLDLTNPSQSSTIEQLQSLRELPPDKLKAVLKYLLSQKINHSSQSK